MSENDGCQSNEVFANVARAFAPHDRRRPLTCDQVAWLLAAIDRYLPHDRHPSVSRSRAMQKYGLLYEIMDVACLRFEDDAARANGTPDDVKERNPSVNAYGVSRNVSQDTSLDDAIGFAAKMAQP